MKLQITFLVLVLFAVVLSFAKETEEVPIRASRIKRWGCCGGMGMGMGYYPYGMGMGYYPYGMGMMRPWGMYG